MIGRCKDAVVQRVEGWWWTKKEHGYGDRRDDANPRALTTVSDRLSPPSRNADVIGPSKIVGIYDLARGYLMPRLRGGT